MTRLTMLPNRIKYYAGLFQSCQTAFALVPACDEYGVPSRLSGRLVAYPEVIQKRASGKSRTSFLRAEKSY